jgi:hypothetical protein
MRFRRSASSATLLFNELPTVIVFARLSHAGAMLVLALGFLDGKELKNDEPRMRN